VQVRTTTTTLNPRPALPNRSVLSASLRKKALVEPRLRNVKIYSRVGAAKPRMKPSEGPKSQATSIWMGSVTRPAGTMNRSGGTSASDIRAGPQTLVHWTLESRFEVVGLLVRLEDSTRKATGEHNE